MTWTYSGDPTSAPKEEVRFLVGDTVQADPLVTDEEIGYALNMQNSPIGAAVMTCRAIAAKFSRLADKSVGDLRISLSQKNKQYLEMADKLQRQAGILSVPYAGGMSMAEKESQAQDTGSTQPAFRRGMMANGSGFSGVLSPDRDD
jgi:hypothetical protein